MPNDVNNLGGQNNKKPPASFNLHHQVVEYNGRIYDPSYGKDFDDIDEWKDQSIDGYYVPAGRRVGEVFYNAWYIRKQY